MNSLPTDLENIISYYKYQLETHDKFKKTLEIIKQIQINIFTDVYDVHHNIITINNNKRVEYFYTRWDHSDNDEQTNRYETENRITCIGFYINEHINKNVILFFIIRGLPPLQFESPSYYQNPLLHEQNKCQVLVQIRSSSIMISESLLEKGQN